ncbi:MAG: histidine kinase [Pseudomonadota bacterium]
MRPIALTADQYLLNLSGLLAIALVGWICTTYFEPLPNLILHGLFAAAFMLQSFAVPLGVPSRYARFAVLLMLILSVLALAINRDTITLVLSVVLVASTPHHFSARASWAMMVVANLAYGAVFVGLDMGAGGAFFSWLTLIALQAFAITSSLAKQREVAAQQTLSRSNSELLAARALIAQQTQTEERLRIAGDLHDSIGHRLTALQLQLEVLSHEAPDSLTNQVETCQTLARDLLEEVRAIVRRMSEEHGDDLSAAIRELEALTPAVSITVSDTLPSVAPELARQLVYCFQEAIHNAIRHGGASEVVIDYRDGAFHVTDNGRGLRGAQVAQGFGLRNIVKRLAPFGGNAKLRARDGGGCELTLDVRAQPAT